jgi:ketosteroid isomerase-like protein
MSTAQMSTYEIGKTLVDLCRQGKNHEAMSMLYSNDIVSVEAGAPPGQERESLGLEATMAKGQWWVDNHIVHSAAVSGPFPKDDQFIVVFNFEVTFKPSGQRFPMEEAGLYTVKDGKIVREEFFYTMG